MRVYKAVIIHRGYHLVEYNKYDDVEDLAKLLESIPAPATVVILVKGENNEKGV